MLQQGDEELIDVELCEESVQRRVLLEVENVASDSFDGITSASTYDTRTTSPNNPWLATQQKLQQLRVQSQQLLQSSYESLQTFTFNIKSQVRAGIVTQEIKRKSFLKGKGGSGSGVSVAELTPRKLTFRQRFARCIVRAMESTAMGVLWDLSDVAIYVFDVVTDLRVLKILKEGGHHNYFILTIIFIADHYFVMSFLLAQFLFRNWKAYKWHVQMGIPKNGPAWLLLVPFALPCIPVLDSMMMFTSIIALVFPKADMLSGFLSNYNFTRVFLEFCMESVPQTILQSYMYFDLRSQQSITQRNVVLVSICASVMNIFKFMWQIHKGADSAGMSIREYSKYLLLLKANYLVPKAVMDLQIAETCKLHGRTMVMNGLHLYRNKTKLGPAQQAYIMLSCFEGFVDTGVDRQVTKWIISGFPLNAINRILQKGITCFENLHQLEVNECAFRGESFRLVATAISKHPHLKQIKVVQSGVLPKYRNNMKYKICKLFKLPLSSVSIMVQWWDLELMRKAAKRIRTNTTLNTLSINFPWGRSKKELTLDLPEAFAGSKLEDGYGAYLQDILMSPVPLQSLSLINHHFASEAAVYQIAQGLKGNTTLTNLNLKGSCIKDHGTIALAKVLQNNTTLLSLNLARCQVYGEGLTSLATALVDNRTLQALDLSYNRVSLDGMAALAQTVRHSTTLESLTIEGWRDTFIHYEIVSLFIEAVGRSRGLRHLNMANCGITDKAVCSLAQSLATNTNLMSLNLNCSDKEARLGDEGVSSMAVMLTRNKALEQLQLRGCHLSVKAVSALSNCLQFNSTLQALDLGQSNLTDKCVQVLMMGLSKNHGLTNLCLSQCTYLGSAGMQAVASMLQINTTLTSLDLSYSTINTDEETDSNSLANILAEGLNGNSALTELNMAHLSPWQEEAGRLFSELLRNTVLATIDLPGCIRRPGSQTS